MTQLLQYFYNSHLFITNQFNDLLPVGLLAQLVERSPGIAEVKGSNPRTRATAKVTSITAMIFFHVSFFIVMPANRKLVLETTNCFLVKSDGPISCAHSLLLKRKISKSLEIYYCPYSKKCPAIKAHTRQSSLQNSLYLRSFQTALPIA